MQSQAVDVPEFVPVSVQGYARPLKYWGTIAELRVLGRNQEVAMVDPAVRNRTVWVRVGDVKILPEDYNPQQPRNHRSSSRSKPKLTVVR